MDINAGENLNMACDTFVLRTTDITETFYFDSYATDASRLGWEDFPQKMVDGILYDESTGLYEVAYTWLSNRIQWCDENSSPTDRDTTVTKVEIRAYSSSIDSNGPVTAYLRPVFSGDSNGDSHSWAPTGDFSEGAVPYWSPWFDITNDTNAPEVWTWAHVNSLDVDHWATVSAGGDPNGCQTAMIELRVTWHDSVVLSGPLPETLNASLEKNQKRFNLHTSHQLFDDDIAGQPLSLEGVENGETSGGLLCVPVCLPVCFSDETDAATSAQTKISKIHSWMENNYDVQIEEFGNCFDAKYAINNFRVSSMHQSSVYKWILELERIDDL